MNTNLRSLPVRTALWLIALSAFLPLRLAAQGTLAPATVVKVYTLLAESGDAEVNLLNWGSTDVKSFTYTLYYMDTQKSSEPAPIRMYDLSGRPVLCPVQKGVYVRNGRKVVR